MGERKNLQLSLSSECFNGVWSIQLTAVLHEAKHADTLQEILNIIREQLTENATPPTQESER